MAKKETDFIENNKLHTNNNQKNKNIIIEFKSGHKYYF